ncbi:hypothetical protein [Reinekea sp.]|uniref:hypothetical protein n=1 Tax=Reinekea sp. TaxID=1970455 RepID=UPI003989FAE5
MKYFTLFSIAIISQLSLLQAESLEVDWLYMSPSGTWLERNETLTETKTPLALPIDNLNPDLFWWQSTDAKTQVTWQSPFAQGWPKQGDVVKSDQLTGDWLIEKVQPQHLVLVQESERRFWPMAQIHLLQWSQSEADKSFELLIEQPTNKTNQFQYAWQDGQINARVTYRLSLTDEPVLNQSLIVSNNSQYDLTAKGYSFAMNQQRPFAVMHEMVSRAQSDMATPQASQSEGIPTLVGNNPVQLNAQANLWLPVSATTLSSVERIYSLTWDTRMQGTQQANSAVKITSADVLPDIPGSITLGVFDQQIATLSSQYQPSSDHEAILNLGQSTLVTLESKVVGENQWSLIVTNRTDEDATLDLLISHWNGKTSEQIPMPIKVKANDMKKVAIQLGVGGKVTIGKK